MMKEIRLLLLKLGEEFKKSEEDITEIFVKVSGDLTSVRDYLEGKRVAEWNSLEDEALGKPEDSNEFKQLISIKGEDEINKRRAFLSLIDEE
jgi:hypothetical protein